MNGERSVQYRAREWAYMKAGWSTRNQPCELSKEPMGKAEEWKFVKLFVEKAKRRKDKMLGYFRLKDARLSAKAKRGLGPVKRVEAQSLTRILSTVSGPTPELFF